MCKRSVCLLVGTGLMSLALASTTAAGTILVFGQTGTDPPNLFTGARVGNSTTLSAVNIPVTITGINAPGGLAASFPNAYLWLLATSTDSAKSVSGQIIQDYSGSFGITSALGGGGVNYLSGQFKDSVFGSGTGLTLSASDAPPNVGGETVAFSSAVIADIQMPHASRSRSRTSRPQP